MKFFYNKGIGSREFISIYDEYNAAIYRYVFVRCYSVEVAQDIVAETFMKFWDYVSKNEDNRPDNVRAYLYRISSNLIADYFNKNKGEVSLDDDTILDFYNSLNIEKDGLKYGVGEVGHIYKVVFSLPDEQREIIVLRYIEDLPYQDISLIMNKGEGALRVLHNRAMKNLRSKLGV